MAWRVATAPWPHRRNAARYPVSSPAPPGKERLMAEFEYLGGAPGHDRAASVSATVQGDPLRLKHGYLLGGWSYQVPLAAITSVESSTAREVLAANLLAATEATRLDQPHERLLIIATAPGDHTA